MASTFMSMLRGCRPWRAEWVLWFSLVSIASLWAAVPAAALAQRAASADSVTIAAAGGRGQQRLTGRILDYNGQFLQLERSAGRVEEIAVERVLEVTTDRGAAHEEADRLFEAQRYGEALERYREAMPAEARRWMRRELLARQAWCYHQLGQHELAGRTFLLVTRDDPAGLHLAWLPLAWRPVQPEPQLERLAAQWVADASSPVGQLLGASWLLATARQAEATAVLRRLETQADRRVARLAVAQQWRLQLASAGRPELERWERVVRELPEPLQAGPWYVVGSAWAQRREADRAALALLRVPVLHPDHHALAGEALLQAARQLEHSGAPQEAVELYRELLARHAGSVAARQAESALEAR